MLEWLTRRLKIRPRLTLSFISVGMLMLVGSAVSLWQLRLMRAQAQYLHDADQLSLLVLRVRSDLLNLQDKLPRLAERQDTTGFLSEVSEQRKTFATDVERASQAFSTLPPGSQREANLTSLEAVRVMFSSQADSLSELASAGDWKGVQLRLELRTSVIGWVSDNLVRDIDTIVAARQRQVLENIRRAQQHATWTLVATGLLMILTAGILGFTVTRSIAQPLAKLDAAARALARGEFQHQPVVVGRNDEIASLSRVFNEMSSRLRALYEALRRSEAYFRSLIENASDFILILNSEGTVLYASPSCGRSLGHESSPVGKRVFDFVHPDDVPALKDFLASRVSADGPQTPLEFRVQHNDGTLRILEALASNLLEDPAVTGIVLNARNITERRQAEEALRASEERYRSLYEGTPSMYFTVDPAGMVLSVNEFGAQQLGYTAEELVGGSVLRVFYEADKPQALAHVEECLAQPGRVFQWELRKVRKDGSLLWVKETARAVQSPDGKLVARIVCEDITEVRHLEEQLLQAQRMEAIGTLSGGIAHDFNNLLTVIRGYSEQLLDRLAHNAELHGQVHRIDEAAERAANLTRQLLAFSRRQVLQPKVFNLNRLAVNLDKMLRRLIGEDIEMVTATDPHLGSVKADPGQIEQVIMNLVLNARDAMPHGGKLTLETANVDLDETYASKHVGVQPGPHVMLAVSDTGVGMDAQTQAHIFEPFFTTKEMGKGTGLGLATVYGIMKQSGGHIWVYSEAGGGSTFKIYLPRVDETAEVVPGAQRPQSAIRGTEIILLVEDDAQVRELARSVLSEKGYTVLVAENPVEVMSLCKQHKGPIHLLLTDVVMPQLSGSELAMQLTARRPEMKVLFMSGYTVNAIVHHGVLNPDTNFLPKPFTPATLVRKVREVLDQGAGRMSSSRVSH